MATQKELKAKARAKERTDEIKEANAALLAENEKLKAVSPEVIEPPREAKSQKLTREELERVTAGSATYNLSVHGKETGLVYFWSDEKRLHQFITMGYTHVSPNDIEGVGGNSIGEGFRNKSNSMGNHVTVNNKGHTLYLLAMERDRYNQIQAYKQKLITEKESAIYNRNDDELYTPDEAAR